MSIIYITKNNISLSKKRQRVLVKKNDNVIADVPIINLDQIVVIGSFTITSSLINLSLEEDIPIIILNYYGQYKGRIVAGYSQNINFRIKQFNKYNDKLFALNLSRIIVEGKLKNMKVIIQSANRKKADKRLEEAVEKIDNILIKLKTAETIEKLRGYEGIGSRYYFEIFNLLINNNFIFNGRNRNPPRDPVNSMLSFGYTLLLNDIISALYIHDLDPYVGFLHSVRNGKPALALDLIEEFRHIIIDRMVKALINKNVITKASFDRDKKIMLKEKSKNIFLKEYENKLNTEIMHPKTGKSLTWRRIIREQARFLKDSIKGECQYSPFEVK